MKRGEFQKKKSLLLFGHNRRGGLRSHVIVPMTLARKCLRFFFFSYILDHFQRDDELFNIHDEGAGYALKNMARAISEIFFWPLHDLTFFTSWFSIFSALLEHEVIFFFKI